MKLKLEAKEGVPVLVVSEEISAQHAAILRAGIVKIFSTGRKELILDLTSCAKVDAVAHSELRSFLRVAQDSEALMVIASSDQTLGQAPDATQAVALLKSPMFGLLTLEARLKNQQQVLEHQRDQLKAKVSGADAATLRQLRKESSDLRQRSKELESQILGLLQGEAADRPLALSPKLSEIRRVGIKVLETLGISVGAR